MGFYTIVRGSVVHKFGVVADPHGMRWYLCAVAVPGRAERHQTALSRASRTGHTKYRLGTDSELTRGGAPLTDLAVVQRDINCDVC